MKKSAVLMLLICCFSTAKAQFSAGDRYLVGSGMISYSDNNNNNNASTNKAFGIRFSPAIITFKSERKATGVKLILGYNNYRNETGTLIVRDNHYTAGVGLLRMNTYALGKGFFLFLESGVQASVTAGYGKDNNTPPNKSRFTRIDASAYAAPGIGYKITERLVMSLCIDSLAVIGYSHTSVKNTSSIGTVSQYQYSNGYFLSALNNSAVAQLSVRLAFRLK
jgi:hypothetical protein